MPRGKNVQATLAERYRAAGYSEQEYIEARQEQMRAVGLANNWKAETLEAALRDIEIVAAACWKASSRRSA